MPERTTLEIAKQRIEKGGEKLLSTEYINSTSLISIQCHKCDLPYEINLKRHQRGHRHICSCKNIKLTHAIVKERIEEAGQKLLSTEYISNKELISILCDKCDQPYNITYANFSQGNRHQKCPEKTHSLHSLQNIRSEQRNSKGKYKYTRLKYSKGINYTKRCINCTKAFIIKYGHTKQILCGIKCTKEYSSKRGREYYERIGRMGGLVSAQVQTRRSKNEIHFAELCEKEFGNVLTNECIFDGWDADIILPDLKTSISYNGIWHYKQVRAGHNLKQVQARDLVKNAIITKKYGYRHYIVKDMGGENKKFVQEEFNKFLEYMKAPVNDKIEENEEYDLCDIDSELEENNLSEIDEELEDHSIDSEDEINNDELDDLSDEDIDISNTVNNEHQEEEESDIVLPPLV